MVATAAYLVLDDALATDQFRITETEWTVPSPPLPSMVPSRMVFPFPVVYAVTFAEPL